MRSRAEIKEGAKVAFKAQWKTCILMGLLYLVIAALSGAVGTFSRNFFLDSVFSLSGPFITISFSFSLFYIFVFPIVYIGMLHGFLQVSRREITKESIVFSKFSNGNYIRCLGGFWWMVLFTFLWMLCFCIPGIVKGFAYSMTPYLLAEYPNLKPREALKMSMRMTAGHKGKLFVFNLSFFGWAILGTLLLCIPLFVYVMPYTQTATASLYDELKEEAFRTGKIRPEELTA